MKCCHHSNKEEGGRKRGSTCTYTHQALYFFIIIKYTMLVAGWTSLSFSCHNSSCYRFNKVLETLLRDFGSYWHETITQLLQTVGYIPIMWIYCSTTPQKYSVTVDVILVQFKKLVWDRLSFVTWCIILLEAGIRRCIHYGHKEMDMVSRNTQVGCGISMIFSWY